MSEGRVTHDGSYRFYVDGQSGLEWANDVLGGPLDVVGRASLTSLRKALHDFMIKLDGEISNEPVVLRLSPVPADQFDHDWGPWHEVSLTLEEGGWSINVELWRDEPFDDAAVGQLLEPLLDRHGASFAGCAIEEFEGQAWQVEVSALWPTRGKTVGDALAVGIEIHHLLEASSDGTLTLSTARDLVIGGHAHLLRGQPENQWLEAKGAPYALQDSEGGSRAAWELAKDVAAFANSTGGGVILIGATTRDRGDGDRITGFREFDLGVFRRQAYRNHVAQKVFPRVIGFEVLRVSGEIPGRGLGLLVIPPQSEADKPFLVQGAVRGGERLGTHVLWPIRREDDTAFVPIERLHALLRLGEHRLRAE